MAGRGVRVLADDEHPDVAERLLEGAQHLLARGQVALARGDLLAQEAAHSGDLTLDRCERFRPARLNDIRQRFGHVGTLARKRRQARL